MAPSRTLSKQTFTSQIFCLLLAVVSLSCSKKAPIGQWENNIQLSQNEVIFGSQKDSITLSAKGSYWWINLAWSGDDKYRGEPSQNPASVGYTIDLGYGRVERTGTHALFIRLNANPNKTERVVHIELEAGDYFDLVTITQKASP
ncbi:MAG: hypothetical protein LWW85_08115 [Marinilabiliales bacterium]|nr:hypothetical protein [Marinilabiliales bacterium]